MSHGKQAAENANGAYRMPLRHGSNFDWSGSTSARVRARTANTDCGVPMPGAFAFVSRPVVATDPESSSSSSFSSSASAAFAAVNSVCFSRRTAASSPSSAAFNAASAAVTSSFAVMISSGTTSVTSFWSTHSPFT